MEATLFEQSAVQVRITVVVAVSEPGSGLEECVASLAASGAGDDLEIVVATATADPKLVTQYSGVRLLQFAPGTAKSELLKEALLQARGDIIAVTEPNCRFPRDWAERICRAHASEFAAIGGAVAYGGKESPAAWACFLADYGPFLPPEPRRTSGLLPGNHVSYKRNALAAVAECWRDGYIKFLVLQELERRGAHILFEPELLAYCMPEQDAKVFARRYYVNARDFAAARAKSFSSRRRFAQIVLAPLLPAVLLWRRWRAVWTKREHRRRLMMAAPLLLVFALCWSAGELTGYLRDAVKGRGPGP